MVGLPPDPLAFEVERSVQDGLDILPVEVQPSDEVPTPKSTRHFAPFLTFMIRYP